MKRAAAVAVALAALAGCGPSGPACPPGIVDCFGYCADLASDPFNCGACGLVCGQSQSCINFQCVTTTTEITFYWRFAGQQGDVFGDYTVGNTGCDTAAVDQVRISLAGPGGPYSQTVNCVQSNGSPGVVVPAWIGANTWTVEGLRTGEPVFRVQGSANVLVPTTVDLTLDGLYGDMNLFYDLPVGQVCLAGDTIQVALYDYDYVPSRLAYTTNFPGYTVPIPCNYPPLAPPNQDNFFVIPSLVPSSATGFYRFNFITVVRTGFAEYQVCNPPGFSWNGVTQDVGYTLGFAAGSCAPLPP
jgi:hypothetical protein